MQKLKLVDEAKAFATEQLAKSTETNDLAQKARWQELLGDPVAAAETWIAAGRKEKAVPLYEQLGQLAKAAELAEAAGQLDRAQALFERAGDPENTKRVAALPRPEPKPLTKAEKAEALEESEAAVESPPPVDKAGEAPPEASA